MSIETELTKLQTNLSNAYTSCNNKGATMPSSQNFDNLATTIDSIETGGGITPTGTFNITANGTYDITTYASVNVNVAGITPTGTLNITENGTYDVTNYASANVSVAGSGGGGISFPAGTSRLVFEGSIESEQLKGAFQHLTSTDFYTFSDASIGDQSWSRAKSKALQEAFKGNQHTTYVSFFAIRYFDATDVLLDCFVDSVVSTIMFNTNARSEVSSQTGYDNKWGAPTATIRYFGSPDI